MQHLSENQFGKLYFLKEAIKFNKLYLIFKNIYLWCPALIFIWYIIPSLWIFPSIGFLILLFWLGSVKMRSLRNINLYASKRFEILHQEEMNKMFR